jgi:hypothetical protein
MKFKPAALWAFVAVSSLDACRRADRLPEVGSGLTRQPVQIVHYGDDGPLARIEGKPGLYGVVFDPDCQSCKIAEEVIQPASTTDISLCEFGMVVSGDIEKTTRQLKGTLRVRRVDQQPISKAGHQQGTPEQPCGRPLSGNAATRRNV